MTNVSLQVRSKLLQNNRLESYHVHVLRATSQSGKQEVERLLNGHFKPVNGTSPSVRDPASCFDRELGNCNWSNLITTGKIMGILLRKNMEHSVF